MKIIRLPDEGEQKILQVEADWRVVSADYDDTVSAYSHVRIPGFRPGKVPQRVIEQRLQKQIIEDLSNRSAQRLGREALREAGAESLGPIEIENIECGKGKPFSFTARFHPMPDIVLPDLGALNINDDGSDPRDQISHRLLVIVTFAIPDEFVKAEIGINDGDADNGSDAWKAAEERVRLMLILKRIAKQEGIEVSESDVDRRIKDKALEFGTSADALRSELEEGGGRRRLKDMLLAESTLDYLTEIITHKKGGQS